MPTTRPKLPRTNRNPNLLTLLRAGARVEFSDETEFVGQPDVGYINIRFQGFDQGLWSLDAQGLKNAQADRKKMVAEARSLRGE